MTRVSSGSKKSGPPAHPNKFAYTHNRNSKLTKTILSHPVTGLCPPCHSVIQWRKKFRKYKMLTVAKKCVQCQGKKIKEAYHIICRDCGRDKRCCEKCLKPHDEIQNEGVEITPERILEMISDDDQV
jgi:hypothetical protein